jgi:hypothetical protein
VSTDHGDHWTHPTFVASQPGEFVSALAFAPTRTGQLLAIGAKRPDSFYVDKFQIVMWAADTVTTHDVMPPAYTDRFVLTGTPCGSPLMLAQTFTQTPRIFAIMVADSAPRADYQPLISGAAISASAGVTSSPRSVIAAMDYQTRLGTPTQSFAAPIAACSR